MSLAPDHREHLAEIARRLDASRHGESAAIVEEACGFYGWSVAKLYTRLKADVGWSSGRKARSDKGSTCVPVASLEMLATMQKESIRANGKQIMHTPTSASVLSVNDVSLPVSNGQLNRLMRARKLDVATQAQADAPVRMRSLHPNHVHQVDPSLCVLYYMKGQQAMMDADKFYKNKLENYAKIKLKVWRYVLYDHTSGLLAVRYFEAAGENTPTLFEFLMWCWGRQEGREFHGVPRILVWDKGSANKAAVIKSLLEGLEVMPIEHAAGKARVKGGVECGNNIIECKFESRLKFQPVSSVAELNAAALAWQNAFNADMIPRESNALRRRGMVPTARYDLWRRIKAAELRILPDVEICRPLLEGKELVRKVRGLAITFKHPAADATRSYRVAGLDGICEGDEIAVRPLLYGDCAIHVRVPRYDGEDLVYRLEADALPDEFGLPRTAAVWNESYKSNPDTAADQAAKRMDALAYPGEDAEKQRQKQAAPFGGTLDAHSHLADIAIPTALPRRGSEINVPDRLQLEVKPLNQVQMASALSRVIDGWGPDMFALMTKLYPDGALEADLPAVVERLKSTPRLVAVG
ncbi:MAG: hypothetical protein PHY45_11830 [Rhodocyclaceae bacterium]|nr:hypothetical protein [Rhodocyclaceae bacterium]